MDTERERIRHLHDGMTLSGLRDHNERLVLSTIQSHEAVAGAEMSRVTGLSAQTISVIIRSLEKEGLVERGEPVRGKVGKPLTPWRLARDGVYSYGLRVGRRHADLVVTDFAGTLRDKVEFSYAYPKPDCMMDFLSGGLARFGQRFGVSRVAGVGIAAPFELWNWLDIVEAPKADMMAWKDFSFADALSKITDLPVFLGNDATLACAAELSFGAGRQLTDFAYFNIDSFAGGGVVLNRRLYAGRTGNAGAFGTLPIPQSDGSVAQLIQSASVYLLERRISDVAALPGGLDLGEETWARHEAHVAPWLADCARQLAVASVAVCSVIDFEAIVIDGWFPQSIRTRLIELVERELGDLDTQGIERPRIIAGAAGPMAGALGAAHRPIQSSYFAGGVSPA